MSGPGHEAPQERLKDIKVGRTLPAPWRAPSAQPEFAGSMQRGLDQMHAEMPGAVPVRRIPSREETGRVVARLTSDPDYQARTEQAQVDQDTGNLRPLEDVQDLLGIPHGDPQEGAESEPGLPS
jgi:hypothetical protein